ncbi:hypothetical protein SLE2022_317830 [Rubroshorea leprosula]
MASDLQPLHLTTSDVCIGSSHGWLIFLDLALFSPFLLNPFTKVRIQLPSLKPVFRIRRIEKRINQAGVFHVAVFSPPSDSLRKQAYPQSRGHIPKAILTSEPVGNYDVVVLCMCRTTKMFAYYRNGDNSWTKVINGAREWFIDYLRRHYLSRKQNLRTRLSVLFHLSSLRQDHDCFSR